MRQEDKEVDGPEIAQAEERRRQSELVEEDDEELYDLDGKATLARDRDQSSSVLAAMQTIFDREPIVIEQLGLSRREEIALEALRTAVDGRDGELGKFVYAEDRRTLLEQALAVLQPDLENIPALGMSMPEMLDRVSRVRDELDDLEDAQEVIEHKAVEPAKQEGDSDDEEDDDTSLTGPERAITKPPSSLGDPAEIAQAAAEQKPPSSLGDPAEIAQATAEKKKPWWRRPFGG